MTEAITGPSPELNEQQTAIHFANELDSIAKEVNSFLDSKPKRMYDSNELQIIGEKDGQHFSLDARVTDLEGRSIWATLSNQKNFQGIYGADPSYPSNPDSEVNSPYTLKLDTHMDDATEEQVRTSGANNDDATMFYTEYRFDSEGHLEKLSYLPQGLQDVRRLRDGSVKQIGAYIKDGRQPIKRVWGYVDRATSREDKKFKGVLVESPMTEKDVRLIEAALKSIRTRFTSDTSK
jgi:hypothetical protein